MHIHYNSLFIILDNMLWEFTRCDQVAVLLSGFPELSINPPGLWLAGPKYCETSGLSNWAEVNSLSNEDGASDQKLFIEHRAEADFITDKLTDARLDADSVVQDGVTRGDIDDKGNQTCMAASLEVVQVRFLWLTIYF